MNTAIGNINLHISHQSRTSISIYKAIHTILHTCGLFSILMNDVIILLANLEDFDPYGSEKINIKMIQQQKICLMTKLSHSVVILRSQKC